MALKSKITKAEFDALNDAIKPEYKVNLSNADQYLLDTDEANDLREALGKSKKERDEAAAERDRLKKEKEDQAAEAQRLKDEAARASGDVAAIEKSWSDKYAALENLTKSEKKALQDTIDGLTKKNVAKGLATEISTAPDLLESHIEARLKTEITDGVAVTRVLDKDGKPSAMSIDELKKEFIANPKYAAIIKGTSASGGGATGGGTGGGATVPTGKKFNTLTEPERVALHAADPAKFKEYVERARKGEDVTVA